MIHRTYLTGEQLYKAYNDVLDGKKEYVIAREFKISTPALKRALHELRNMLAGGELRRQKTREVFTYAQQRITADHIDRQARMEPPRKRANAYDLLQVALASLNSAVEQVILHEVDRRITKLEEELKFYKDIAQKSNVAYTLQKHFEGKI